MKVETLVDFVNKCKGEWRFGDRSGVRLKCGDYVCKTTLESLVKELSEAAWIPEHKGGSLDKALIDASNEARRAINDNLDRIDWYRFNLIEEEKPVIEVSPHVNIRYSDTLPKDKSDQVKNPKHYDVVPNVQAKAIIETVLNSELTKGMTQYQIYCLGNTLKYRLRTGKKDNLQQDIDKAEQYVAMGWGE